VSANDGANPYIAGSPVTGTDMFFGRDDVFDVVRRSLVGRHRDNGVVLYGARRTGKTSLLYQIERRLSDTYACVLIDLHGLALKSFSGFLWELANAISRTLKRTHDVEVSCPSREAMDADARELFCDTFLSDVQRALGDRRLLLLLDEADRLHERVEAGDLGRDVFEFLRHLLQHYSQISFVIAVGSAIEELQKEYARLFSGTVYQRISFLEPKAARALVTDPVADLFEVPPSTVDRVLAATSGHPYYTQLVCHALFNQWLQDPSPSVGPERVDAALADAAELGAPNLKYVWAEATPGERVVMAALAKTTGPDRRGASPSQLRLAWEAAGITLADPVATAALRTLVASDVVTGEEEYVFAADPQRLWVQRHGRLEWVKNELPEALIAPADTAEIERAPGAAETSRAEPQRVLDPVFRLGYPRRPSRRRLAVTLLRPFRRHLLLLIAAIVVLVSAPTIVDLLRDRDVVDVDRDGSSSIADCNDRNASIHPGADEIRGNRVDENCNGVAEALKVESTITHSWGVAGPAITLNALQIRDSDPPKGWSAHILCRGERCPFQSKTLNPGKVTELLPSFKPKQRQFRGGQVVELWVTAPDHWSRVLRLPLHDGQIPRHQALCAPPGSDVPTTDCEDA